MLPFEQHAALVGQYQGFIAGGNRGGLATLTFTDRPNSPVIPCTHTEIMASFDQVPGGKSATTFVEQCEFLVSDAAFLPTNIYLKGEKVNLTVKDGTVWNAQFWIGGIQQGAGTFRFMLVDANYHG